MKQTAVQWLQQHIDNKDMGEIPIWVYQFIEQAVAMEKNQIVEAHMAATLEYVNPTGFDVMKFSISSRSEQYYTETYAKTEMNQTK